MRPSNSYTQHTIIKRKQYEFNQYLFQLIVKKYKINISNLS